MASNNLKVIIIGSGLGGLSLAQSLSRSGIPFEIYERDASPFERTQGYRLHLDEDAINTVAEILPADLQAVFNKTSHFTEPFTDIMKPDSLRVVKRLPTKDDLGMGMWPEQDHNATPVHANVDRATLREILLTGLEPFTHFGKKFVRYESDASGVRAHFSDGTTATGTVLVGADGVSSRVRSQRSPASRNMDAGITAIYGRVPIDVMKEMGSEEVLNDIFTIASDSRKVFLGLGSVIFPNSPDEAATGGVAKLSPKSSYSVCIVGGRHQFFPESTRHDSPEQLQKTAAELVSTSEWSEKAAPLIRVAEPGSFFSVHMQSSVPSELPPASNVTLLGDAIHAMTPSLGRGANLAMRHGALLGRRLRNVSQGAELAEELAKYEKSMTEYGFGVVREAAAIGAQRMAQTPLE